VTISVKAMAGGAFLSTQFGGPVSSRGRSCGSPRPPRGNFVLPDPAPGRRCCFLTAGFRNSRPVDVDVANISAPASKLVTSSMLHSAAHRIGCDGSVPSWSALASVHPGVTGCRYGEDPRPGPLLTWVGSTTEVPGLARTPNLGLRAPEGHGSPRAEKDLDVPRAIGDRLHLEAIRGRQEAATPPEPAERSPSGRSRDVRWPADCRDNR